ncbi:glutamate-gated chloride channel-like [Penaeus japonicus]|uniref:glutamate-gated chloride channel-like n=1 Tax=Penaeus japonicus TaxID=27405 RepID=UPI001C713AF7|nr:glutamate-gated chloride channel-like [Penaeus japonicus]
MLTPGDLMSVRLIHLTRSLSKDQGSDNLLVQEEEVTLTIRCQFDLQMYPFDRQRCALIIKIQDLFDDFFTFIKDGPGVMFLGNRRLLEYYVVGESFSILAHDGTHSLKIELKLRNLYGFYLSNTFLPTFMLVFICCATLCFDIADFQDRIMVSLTSLLVMATIFVQTSENITKTSYLKFIDLWFVAMMSEDFFIILGLVVVEVLRLREAKRGLTQESLLALPRAATVNRILLVFFFCSLITMLLCFVVLSHVELNKDG